MKSILHLVLFIFTLFVFSQEKSYDVGVKSYKELETDIYQFYNNSKEIPIYCYPNTKDFLKKDYKQEPISAIVTSRNYEYIFVEKFFNNETGKRTKNFLIYWGVEYNGEEYININYLMKNSNSISKYDNRVYLKPLITGNIFYVFSYNDFSSRFVNQFRKRHNESSNKNLYLDKYGNKNSIHAMYMQQEGKRFNGMYLTRKALKRIIKSFNIEINKPIEDLMYEEVLDIFKQVNGYSL